MSKKEQAQKIAAESEALQKVLNPENKKYYEDLLVYVRTKNIFKDEAEVEELLLQILSDLVEAQKHVQNAESYLGKDPEALGDELIDSVKGASFSQLLRFFAIGFGVYLLFSVLGDLSSGAPLILGYDLIDVLLLFPTIYVTFYLLSNSIYSTKKWLPVIPLAGFIILHSLIPSFIPPFLLIATGGPVRVGILIVSGLLLLGFILKEKFYEFLPALIYFYTFSILQFNYTFAAWQKTMVGGIVSLVVLLITSLLMYLIFKKRNKEK